MADAKTTEHVRMALKAVDVIPLHVHEPDRLKKTVTVQVGSQGDAAFIRAHGVTMKPQNVFPFPSPFSLPLN